MTVSRREFLETSVKSGLSGAAALALPGALAGSAADSAAGVGSSATRLAGAGEEPWIEVNAGGEPWLEVDAAALRHCAAEVGRLAGGRPLLAVVKNNAYGLGLRTVGPILDAAPEVIGLGVVKVDEAMELRDAGVAKPILLMGAVETSEAIDLVRRGIRLAPFDDGADRQLAEVARAAGRAVPVHVYIDTGMSRLGMPYHRALPWIEALAARQEVRIEGMFTTFTEDDEFDVEQLARFRELAAGAAGRGIEIDRLHAASSHALFFRPDARLDMARPGLTLYGAYPAGAYPASSEGAGSDGAGMDGTGWTGAAADGPGTYAGREEASPAEATAGAPWPAGAAALRPVFRLRARVARVERLRPGDSVSYGRDYVAERPTWVATIPAGHADGYPRSAVEGCEILIGGRVYPVIGAVSASHCIIEVGGERAVEPGDVATLVGPDHPAVHPNTISRRAGISVYDVLMHLSARLPLRVIGADRSQDQPTLKEGQ